MAKWIQLTQNQVAKVDDEDFEWLSAWKWNAHDDQSSLGWYALFTRYADGGKPRRLNIKMHNLIWENYYGPLPEGYTVDHKDRDGLNNQKSNLRLATKPQQSQNQGLRKDNTSGYKGVSWHKTKKKYTAYIVKNKKLFHLGLFTDPVEAARVRDAAALEEYGEFAFLNFPQELEV